MRIQVDFYIDNNHLKFYNPLTEAMTGFLYRMIAIGDKKYATTLHNGYSHAGHKKFVHHAYSFSQDNQIVQLGLKRGKATLVLSSVLEDTIINFTKGLIRTGQVQLFGYGFDIQEITYIKEPKFDSSNMFRTLSPICCLGSGYEWLSVEQVEEKSAALLIEKYYSLHNRLPMNSDVRVKMLAPKTEYMKYKGLTFKTYSGSVIIEGDKDIVKLAYQGGLGSKCGLGMGLLEAI